MPLKEHIVDIQCKLGNNEYPNEQSISQGIVLHLLSKMQWPVYDTQLVMQVFCFGNTQLARSARTNYLFKISSIQFRNLAALLVSKLSLFGT